MKEQPSNITGFKYPYREWVSPMEASSKYTWGGVALQYTKVMRVHGTNAPVQTRKCP